MAQFARPDSNVTTTGFTGGFADLDEVTASDVDFAYTADNTLGLLEVGLSNVTDPEASTGHVLRYRLAKADTDVPPSTTGNTQLGTVSLYQGATLIAADAEQTLGAWTSYSLTLTGGQADAITDYTDLRIRFDSPAGGAGPTGNRRGGAISWAELEVPNAPVRTDAPAATAAGTGIAYVLSASTTATPPVVVGTGAAANAAANVAAGAQAASGTGAALNTTTSITDTAPAGTSLGTGTAANVSTNIRGTSGASTGTGTANNATGVPGGRAISESATGTGSAVVAGTKLETGAGAAVGTAQARQPTTSLGASAGHATGAGAVNDASGSEITWKSWTATFSNLVSVNTEANAGVAAGSGTASNSTISITDTAPAQTAQGTGSAASISASVKATSGVATGTGIASNAVGAQAAGAQAASGTGSASGAKATVAASAQAATGTGSASNTTGGLAPAEGAQGAGSAANASIKLGLPSGVAAGTGAASNATGSNSPYTYAPAQTATGTGLANDTTTTGSSGLVFKQTYSPPQGGVAFTPSKAPIPGNLLVMLVNIRNGTEAMGAVTGWNLIADVQTPAGSWNQRRMAMIWRIAAAGSVSWVIPNGSITVTYAEFAGYGGFLGYVSATATNVQNGAQITNTGGPITPYATSRVLIVGGIATAYENDTAGVSGVPYAGVTELDDKNGNEDAPGYWSGYIETGGPPSGTYTVGANLTQEGRMDHAGITAAFGPALEQVVCAWEGTMLARGDGPQPGNNGRTAWPNYQSAGGAYYLPVPMKFTVGQTYTWQVTVQHSVAGAAGTYSARIGLSGDPTETANGSIPGIMSSDLQSGGGGDGTYTGSFVAGGAAVNPQYFVVSIADGNHSGTNYGRVTFSIRSSAWPGCLPVLVSPPLPVDQFPYIRGTASVRPATMALSPPLSNAAAPVSLAAGTGSPRYALGGASCTTTTYNQTAPVGASGGGHIHWMGPAVDLCASVGFAMRIYGTFTLDPQAAWPFNEGSVLGISLNPAWDGSGGTPGGTQLGPAPAFGATVSFDKVWAYNAQQTAWGWIDYTAVGTGGWVLADLANSSVPNATQFRVFRNGQWSSAVSANYTVEWIDLNATCWPPSLVQSATGWTGVTLPSAPTPGNYLLLWKAGGGEVGVLQAGFTDLATVYNTAIGNHRTARLMYRVVQPGDTTAVAFAHNNQNGIRYLIEEWSGVASISAASKLDNQLDSRPFVCGGPVTPSGLVSSSVVGFANIFQGSNEPRIDTIAPLAGTIEVYDDSAGLDYPVVWAGYQKVFSPSGGSYSVGGMISAWDMRTVSYCGATVVLRGCAIPLLEPPLPAVVQFPYIRGTARVRPV